ncbi:MAG: hypothetical protein DHS20C16_32890 [Phycisphaerae bacterium]|nr:MAG: hypothetical protein DHS20C16_32890 [Phycisphaerae bacterium]
MDPLRIKPTSLPLRRDDVTFHVIDDEALIYDPDRGATHRLNSTARFIWEHCDGAADCESIAAELTGVWDASSQQACDDVLLAVGSMVENGLLKVTRN